MKFVYVYVYLYLNVTKLFYPIVHGALAMPRKALSLKWPSSICISFLKWEELSYAAELSYFVVTLFSLLGQNW